EHSLHGCHGSNLTDRSRGTVEAGKNTELDLRKADAGRLVARGDAVMTGEDELQPAADAHAVNGGHYRHGHHLDTVEQGVDGFQRVNHLCLGFKASKLADIRADDETTRLARHDHEPADRLIASASLGALDDLCQFLKGPPAQSIR